MATDKPYEVLQAENEILRKRLAKMETRSNVPVSNNTVPADSQALNPNLVKLIQQKDQTLNDYTQELESNAAELRETIEQLNLKNTEATNNLRTIELYKSIVENEPSAIFGLDTNKFVVLFNQGAITLLGERVQGAIFSPIESLGLDAILPEIHTMIDEAIKSQTSQTGTVTSNPDFEGSRVLTYPLMDGDDLRGAIVRISQ